jgi:uncharacterized damage-inducible protein DinB
MPLPQYLDELFRHMAWADAVVWRAVLGAGDDDRTYRLLLHMHQVQHAFLSVWRGEETPPWRDFSAFPDLPSVAKWGREYHDRVPELLASVREEDLDQVREVTWKGWVEKTIGRPPAPSTFAETMLQVSQHSTYHRGQVNARLRERAIDPPLTDFIAWVWLGKPGPEWPS